MAFEPAAKPELRAVLDYAGIRYRDKRGGQKIACPVHADRKPSCSLDLDLGLYNCLSCGASGDAWTLLMITEGITSFKDAVKLADKLGLPRVDDEGAGRTTQQNRGSTRRNRSSLVGDGREGGGTRAGGWVPSWKR